MVLIVQYSCAVVSVFGSGRKQVLVYILIYLEYNTVVVLCQLFGSGGKQVLVLRTYLVPNPNCHGCAVPITTGKKRYGHLSIVMPFQIQPEKKEQTWKKLFRRRRTSLSIVVAPFPQSSGHHSLHRSDCHGCTVPITTKKKKDTVVCPLLRHSNYDRKKRYSRLAINHCAVPIAIVAPFQLRPEKKDTVVCPLLRHSNYDRKKKDSVGHETRSSSKQSLTGTPIFGIISCQDMNPAGPVGRNISQQTCFATELSTLLKTIILSLIILLILSITQPIFCFHRHTTLFDSLQDHRAQEVRCHPPWIAWCKGYGGRATPASMLLSTTTTSPAPTRAHLKSPPPLDAGPQGLPNPANVRFRT